MAIVAPPADPEDRIRGWFFAHHEPHGMQEWQVRDGRLTVEPDQDRYGYPYASRCRATAVRVGVAGVALVVAGACGSW